MRIVQSSPSTLILPRETYSPDIAAIVGQRTDRLGDHYTRRQVVHELMMEGLKAQLDMLAPLVTVLVDAASRANQGYLPLVKRLDHAEKAATSACPKQVVEQANALYAFRKFLSNIENSQALLRLASQPIKLVEDFYLEHIRKFEGELPKILLNDLQVNLARFVLYFQRLSKELNSGDVNIAHISDFVSSCTSVRARLATVMERIPTPPGSADFLQELSQAINSLEQFCSDTGRNATVMSLCDRRILTLDGIQDKVRFLKRGNEQASQVVAGLRIAQIRGALGAIHSALPDDVRGNIKIAELSQVLVHPFGVGCYLDAQKFTRLWGTHSAAISLANGVVLINSLVPIDSATTAFFQVLLPKLFATSVRPVEHSPVATPYTDIIEACKGDEAKFSKALLGPRVRSFLAVHQADALLDLFTYASVGWPGDGSPLELSSLSRTIDRAVHFLSTTGPKHPSLMRQDVVQQHVTAMDHDLEHLNVTLNQGFSLCTTKEEWIHAVALISILPMERWDRFPKLVQAVCKRSPLAPS
ncbi:MAG: hypothetical protein K1X79_03615 [Oligoflexia bacterium]|nr:hypothetical protein [Oligoflexia bacterium]